MRHRKPVLRGTVAVAASLGGERADYMGYIVRTASVRTRPEKMGKAVRSPEKVYRIKYDYS